MKKSLPHLVNQAGMTNDDDYSSAHGDDDARCDRNDRRNRGGESDERGDDSSVGDGCPASRRDSNVAKLSHTAFWIM